MRTLSARNLRASECVPVIWTRAVGVVADAARSGSARLRAQARVGPQALLGGTTPAPTLNQVRGQLRERLVRLAGSPSGPLGSTTLR